MVFGDGVGRHVDLRRVDAARQQRALSRAALLRLPRQHFVLHVVAHLLLAAAVALLDGVAHRVGAGVGVEDHVALRVARGASGDLRERPDVAQESLLVGVEDRHERHLRQVESLAQQVHAYQHVEHPGPQVFENLDALQRVDVRVDVAVAYAHAVEVFRKLLGHAFGDGRHEHLVVVLHALVDLPDQVVDLVQRHAHLQRRVHQPRGADQLFDDHAFALHQLVVRGRGAHVDRRALQLFELREGQRAVVLGRREAEAVLHEVLLAGAVAAEHGVDLRQGDVALVHDHQVVLREIVDQAEGARALGAAVEITRVVFDAGAVPQLLDHLDVVFHALFDTLRLRRASGTLEEFDLPTQIQVYLLYGAVDALLGGYEEARGVERQVVERVDTLPRRGVDGLDGLDLVVVEHYAEALAAELAEGRHDVHRVAVDAKRRRFQVAFGAGVERFDQLVEEMLVADDLPDPDVDGRGMEIRRVACAVEARYARYDDHVAAPRQQRGYGAQAQFLDLGVDRKVFFDIGVRRRQVGLRLVVIVVGDEILHGVFGKEVPEFAVKLRC